MPPATVKAVASTPTNNETLAPYAIRTSKSRPRSSVPSQNVPLGPTGWPSAVRPVVDNCCMLPCPVMAAKIGAPIAQATMTTMTARLIIAARSRRSRRQASIHGLLPSISCRAASARTSARSTGSSDSPTACDVITHDDFLPGLKLLRRTPGSSSCAGLLAQAPAPAMSPDSITRWSSAIEGWDSEMSSPSSTGK